MNSNHNRDKQLAAVFAQLEQCVDFAEQVQGDSESEWLDAIREKKKLDARIDAMLCGSQVIVRTTFLIGQLWVHNWGGMICSGISLIVLGVGIVRKWKQYRNAFLMIDELSKWQSACRSTQ